MADVNGNGNGAPPVANRAVVQGELRSALASRHRNRHGSVLLLRAAAEWRDDIEFDAEVGDVVDGGKVPVAVAPCPTVLAVLDALTARRDGGRYLVVLTPCETREVGDSVLARAMRSEIKPINRWDLVADAFGARSLDPALTRSKNSWVAEALLDAQPVGGWRRLTGTILTRATALNRLATTRLGMDPEAGDGGVDAAALLQWTTDPAAVDSFLRLREAEREGLTDWLKETANPVAGIVFAMASAGKIPDAVPFGLAVAALYGDEAQVGDGALTARVRAEERYLTGWSPGPAALQAFGEAAESLVTRWTDNGHAPWAAELCERAEVMLSDLGASTAAQDSKVLDAGLDARFVALAETISRTLTDSTADALASAEEALCRVRKHGRKRERDAEVRAAEAAVRVTRWLAFPEQDPVTVADAAMRMLRSWAWADRALAGVAHAGSARVPRLAEVYATLWERARGRRAQSDEVFASKLAAWTQASSATDGLLLVENLLDRIARPVVQQRAPVVIVLDGMTAAAGYRPGRGTDPRGLGRGRPPPRRPRAGPRDGPVGYLDFQGQPAHRNALCWRAGRGTNRLRRVLGQA